MGPVMVQTPAAAMVARPAGRTPRIAARATELGLRARYDWCLLVCGCVCPATERNHTTVLHNVR